jgi:o-succinylbenzoate synthase
MRIDTIELIRLAVPLKSPLGVGSGAIEQFETVLVKLSSGSVVGWGEAPTGAGPSVSPEYASGAFGLLRDWICPKIVGQLIGSSEDLSELLGEIRGNTYARSAVDCAWWDLNSRIQDRPLHAVLGGSEGPIPLGRSFDQQESVDPFLQQVAEANEKGYSHIELKFRPGWDFQILGLVRQELPTANISIDAEGSMRLDHTDLFCRLDDFQPFLAEQLLPFEDLVGHAMIAEMIQTPLGLDESITTLAQAEMAAELGSAKYIKVNPSHLGGLSEAISIFELSDETDFSFWVGSSLQTAIGNRAALALASRKESVLPFIDLTADGPFEADLAEPIGGEAVDGVLMARLWDTPGIGIEPDEQLLDRWTIEKVTLG